MCARQICRIVPYFSREMAASTKFTKGKRYRNILRVEVLTQAI